MGFRGSNKTLRSDRHLGSHACLKSHMDAGMETNPTEHKNLKPNYCQRSKTRSKHFFFSKQTLIYFNTDTQYANFRGIPFIKSLSVVLWLDKGFCPKMCILCVRLKINKRSFEPFRVWILLNTALH